MSEVCTYCGTDYTDPNGVASNDYMEIGHYIMECDEIPQYIHDYYNKPWVR